MTSQKDTEQNMAKVSVTPSKGNERDEDYDEEPDPMSSIPPVRLFGSSIASASLVPSEANFNATHTQPQPAMDATITKKDEKKE